MFLNPFFVVTVVVNPMVDQALIGSAKGGKGLMTIARNFYSELVSPLPTYIYHPLGEQTPVSEVTHTAKL